MRLLEKLNREDREKLVWMLGYDRKYTRAGKYNDVYYTIFTTLSKESLLNIELIQEFKELKECRMDVIYENAIGKSRGHIILSEKPDGFWNPFYIHSDEEKENNDWDFMEWIRNIEDIAFKLAERKSHLKIDCIKIDGVVIYKKQ